MSLKLYHFEFSGHSHRVRLFLSLLGLDYEAVSVDIRNNEQKAPEYLKLSPLGQVPTLVDGDDIITDSTAALVYLAKKYDDRDCWLPDDPATAANIQVWLSTASGELFRGPSTARAIKVIGKKADYDEAKACAEQLFQWMQSVLSNQTWLATDRVTIADIAMYTYTRVAHEGELDVTSYPAILRWLENMEKLGNFEPMPRIR